MSSEWDRDAIEEWIVEHYADWSYDDPDWWEDMIEILTDLGSRAAADEWHRRPHA